MIFVGFVVVMFILTRIGWWVFEHLQMPVDQRSFLVGMILTIISGTLSFRFHAWVTTATRPRRPQTVTLQTNETPAQIMGAAFGAILCMLFTIGAMLLAAYVAVFVLP
jgi:hypothetical protein